ncbi:unnamed protein product, partial [Amoebophrya sp. A120]
MERLATGGRARRSVGRPWRPRAGAHRPPSGLETARDTRKSTHKGARHKGRTWDTAGEGSILYRDADAMP